MLLLDSAAEDDARRARQMAWVGGITTNPKLMAAAPRTPLDQLRVLLGVFEEGPVFFQPADPGHAEEEVRRALEAGGGRVVAKLPAQGPMVTLGKQLATEGHAVAFTAVYAPAQAAVGAEAGARWIIPYVDRVRRLRPEPPLVPALRSVLDALGAPSRILAASVKSPEQAVEALLQGADDLTLPLEVLEAMPADPLTDEAVEEFAAAARGAAGAGGTDIGD